MILSYFISYACLYFKGGLVKHKTDDLHHNYFDPEDVLGISIINNNGIEVSA